MTLEELEKKFEAGDLVFAIDIEMAVGESVLQIAQKAACLQAKLRAKIADRVSQAGYAALGL